MRTKNRTIDLILMFRSKVGKMMNCICPGNQLQVDEIDHSSESLATRDYSASGFSSRTAEVETKVETSNIEEAESSLRQSGFLNYEEARALLGRLEYQKGNVEAALHVFEGIDITAVAPRMTISISRRCGQINRPHSQGDSAPLMSLHAVSLLLEAVYLKAKSLQSLGRFAEAAKSCIVVLDTVQSALPEGLTENFAIDCKLQEISTKSVELLPELWKLAGSLQECILSYRRALLYRWNLDMKTSSKMEKEFAVFLLYSGCEANAPNLGSQMEGSFVAKNNLEEAVLLLLILMRKYLLGRIGWDPSIVEHLTFALTISGDFRSLAHQVQQLLPGIISRREKYCTLALCFYAEGEYIVALNLLRNFLNNRENSNCILELLLTSKLCAENLVCLDQGISFVQKAISMMHGKCSQMLCVANCLFGVLLSAESRSVVSHTERILKQAEALKALETAEKATTEKDPYIVFNLCLELAEQRKLDLALYFAKQLLRLVAGSSAKGYLLLARILSAQKRFSDAETVINVALEQTGKWDQGELLRTKAKLQTAQGQVKKSIESYTRLLAVLQVQTRSFDFVKKLTQKKSSHDRRLEMEAWHDLANIYTGLSQWRDAEVCLSKSEAINPYSAARWHSTGLLYEAKGLDREALKAYKKALDVEAGHVPSLISAACVLRRLGGPCLGVVRSLLGDALRLDRMNSSAWYYLGLLYKSDERASAMEIAECFEASALLEESAPVEPFR